MVGQGELNDGRVILDGFICTAAAACLAQISETALDHTIAGHQSAEGAHAAMLDKLGKEPLLSLGLRLGEGSGGALAINILETALLELAEEHAKKSA